MSTCINDLPSAAVLAGVIQPASISDPGETAAVELAAGNGVGFAVLQVNSVTPATTFTVTIEESNDQSTWATVSGGAFAAVTTGDQVQAVRYRRSRRYLRLSYTITGDTPEVVCSALLGEQRITF